MEDHGLWSVLPPVIAIILAIWTRQVFIALLFGVWLGWVIIEGGNIITGTIASIEALVHVFEDAGNTRTIIFCALVGALIAFIQQSGGVEGFIVQINHFLHYMERKNAGNNIIVIQLLAFLTGLLIFVESSISVLTVGALYRPVFDKLKISREKLAYIADSTSAPSCILIPFNAWGAYVMSLLAGQGFDTPFRTLFQAFPYNFYPMLALLLVMINIFWKRDIGPMAQAEYRTKVEGKLVSDNSQPVVSSEITILETKVGIQPKAINMILPIAAMVSMMPVMLIYTGWSKVAQDTNVNIAGKLFAAISQGSGSAAVLYAVLTSLLVAAILYRVQRIMKTGEMINLALKGIGGLIPLSILMVFAFAISNVCKSLGTGIFVARVSEAWISPGLVPFIIFVVSSFIAFSTGTSFGTFAIMIAISVPLAQTMESNVYLTIAAALGGGIFGDHCSPISDTTIISSMAAATDHIDHVKTQLPYALFAGAITAVMYLVLGLVMH